VLSFLSVLFASISQVIGCEDRLRNDLYFVGWGVKVYSNQTLVSALCYDVIHDVFVLFTFAEAEVIFFTLVSD